MVSISCLVNSFSEILPLKRSLVEGLQLQQKEKNRKKKKEKKRKSGKKNEKPKVRMPKQKSR